MCELIPPAVWVVIGFAGATAFWILLHYLTRK